jgi:hypothetical protein
MPACLRVVFDDGSSEPFDPTKTMALYQRLCAFDTVGDSLDPRFVHVDQIQERLLQGLPETIQFSQLVRLMSEIPAYMSQQHPDYGRLAGRVVVAMMRKSTKDRFSECVAQLAENVCSETSKHAPLVSQPFADFVRTHADTLDSMIV